ncbi:MAG: hypothetical protein M3Q74_08510 [Pseudomonadota bacterium]|nr:hypothetical protein [Pseudomonadota bacterium]
MKPIRSRAQLEEFGRERLSPNFFMRDFLYSEIAATEGMSNAPDDPDLALRAGRHLCLDLLEPIQEQFGRIAVRSAYRSSAVNARGNELGASCARNEANYASHIWDRHDASGRMGATACIVVPRIADYCGGGGDWRALAWWIHDRLPYSTLYFFPKLTAFNIQWREEPERRIDSYVAPKGCLTRSGMDNHGGDHSAAYRNLLNEH